MAFNVNIDSSEFNQFDFGFELVDSPIPETKVESTPSISDDFVERFDALENKINTVLSLVCLLEDDDTPDSTPHFNKINEKLDKILSLETQDILNAMNGQSESIRAVIDEVEERKGQLEQEYKLKLKKVEELVLPLLVNLTKNPEREYIKWPNRAQLVQTQINKIIEVTRGDGN